jgi:hypothetical protein
MNLKNLLGAAAIAAAVQTLNAAEMWQGDNLFTLNAALGYNLKLSSRNLEAAAPNPGPATGTMLDRFYDNGYVRVDASGNAGGFTTWWKFDTALGATYDGQPGGSVTLSTTRSPAQGETFTSKDDPHPGVEFGYGRRLVRLGDGERPWMIVGLEARFSLLDMKISDSQTMTGDAVTTDTYHLAPGNVVVGSSFEGSFLGPGPLLGSEPTSRAFTTGTATLSQQLDGQMYGFSVGPTLEFPVANSLLLTVSGGWTLTGVDADSSYQETVTIGGGTPVTSSGSSHFDSWQGGLYVRGAAAVALGHQWQVQAGVQWQDTGAMSSQAGKYETRLDLGQVVMVTLGLGYSF